MTEQDQAARSLRALDARVAERLFGWRWEEIKGVRCLRSPDGLFGALSLIDGSAPELYPSLPQYSSDVGAAWLVVDELRRREIGLELNIYPDGVCEWWILKNTGDHYEHFDNGVANTAPLAIVLAALATVGEGEDER